MQILHGIIWVVNTQEIMNASVVIGFLTLAVCVVFITYYLIKALKSIAALADSLQDTTQEIRSKLQLKFLAAIPAIMLTLASKIFKKRG